MDFTLSLFISLVIFFLEYLLLL
ncbi:hypothetical protein LINGRAHAP2_LOCUS6050 [Linum grandiflorum]